MDTRKRLPRLDEAALRTHAHLMGGTGSGKSSVGVFPMGSQLIAHADSSVIVIDMKGDNTLAKFLARFEDAPPADQKTPKAGS